MVLVLKPVRFYGSALPRPRIYENVKFNDHRVDPPVSANDALLEWASQAHWSMGGSSFQRHRMQGKIEGRLSMLRSEKEDDTDSVKEEDDPPAPSSLKKRLRSGTQEPEITPCPRSDKKKRLLTEESDHVPCSLSRSKKEPNLDTKRRGSVKKRLRRALITDEDESEVSFAEASESVRRSSRLRDVPKYVLVEDESEGELREDECNADESLKEDEILQKKSLNSVNEEEVSQKKNPKSVNKDVILQEKSPKSLKKAGSPQKKSAKDVTEIETPQRRSSRNRTPSKSP